MPALRCIADVYFQFRDSGEPGPSGPAIDGSFSDGHYKILPAINNWSSAPERIGAGKKVADDFVYASDNNDEWMPVEELRDWIEKNGFEHFAPEGNRSVTLTCAANNRDIDLGKWNGLLKSEHSLMINAGYGKIKGKTFRISNMGDETEETIASMLAALDATLPKV